VVSYYFDAHPLSATKVRKGQSTDMDLEVLIIWLVVGTSVGWLVGKYRGSVLLNAVVGIVGAFVGGWLLPRVGLYIVGGLIAAIINALLGALVLLLAASLLVRGYTPIRAKAEAPNQPTGSANYFGSLRKRASQEKVFISYRRDDSRHVTGRIYDRLIKEFGDKSVFRDVDSIPLGLDFRKHVDETISQCDVCLVVIGDDWLAVSDKNGQRRIDDPRDHVRIEIEAALRRTIPVVPLLVGGAVMPSIDELPPSLQDLAFRNGIPVRPDPDFHRDVDRLLSGLKQK
jgi:uncharacterized membrane protein YeaQ/YmgE (transglycosylase-associated protein family)